VSKNSLRLITQLLPHEEYNITHAIEVAQSIEKIGLQHPIVVDDTTNIIIDGHHRVIAYKILGLDLIPVISLNMSHPNIILEWRREEFSKNTKEDVFVRALSGMPYPQKTTRFMFLDEHSILRKLWELV
jgi:hypothetical protein